ncbi:hypothetical protein ACHAWF_003237, partial [Thalassiosira exigua]
MTLKPPKTENDPAIYLGAKLTKMSHSNGEAVWKSEVHSKGNYGKKYGMIKNAPNPFVMEYDPMTDVPLELNPEEASYVLSIIGIMYKMIELGPMDIATEVVVFSSQLSTQGTYGSCSTCDVHLKGTRHNSRLALDSLYPTVDEFKFNSDADWTAFYGNVTEAVLPNATEPCGKEVDLGLIVDSDHAGDKSTRQSCTGYM